MAVFHPHTVQCACGNRVTAELADSINVTRFPAIRDVILRGELHRVTCTACSRQMTVEKPFYYLDVKRAVLFRVAPRGERHLWKDASSDLRTASDIVPPAMLDDGNRTLRVVFGLDELREKLIAQDAKLDDRVVELLKVLLVYEHPVLLRRPRLRLILDAVADDGAEFVATYEHDAQRFRLTLPRQIVENAVGDEKRLRTWVANAHDTSVFALQDDHWVNMWRWSPQPTALDRLRHYAAKAQANESIDHDAEDFRQMLGGLPRGDHLPPWAKRDLRTLFEHAKANGLGPLQDQLFEIRFGITLEDDWSTNHDGNGIDTLWKLLKDLPDLNVEGNTKIREILLDVGKGGGGYDPSSHDIAIGSNELANRERFEDVVRHEVGHAVHEMHDVLVNDWLTQRFGWQMFGSNDADIDAWVQAMGGWGDLTTQHRRDVRGALRTALGNGSSWQSGPTPYLPPGHPWNRADFGPRLAFERTGGNWFRNFTRWHRTGGKAFFLNYWYRTLVAVDVAALDLVAKLPDDYAAMSHYEFFAELYAFHYDPDEDHSVLPPDVADWIDDNVGTPEPGAPMRPRMAPKREWESTVRPRRRG